MKYLLISMLVLSSLLQAADEETFTPADALYAPEEMTGTAATPGQAPLSVGSYYSQAKLLACDFTREGRELQDAELFIDGKFVGKSPLSLNAFLVTKSTVAFSARLSGYSEALRPAMVLPAEGEARIYLLSESATSWYTTPAFVAGLLALGGSIFAYSDKSSNSDSLGLGLVCGGVGAIALTQGWSHFFHWPALQKSVERKNAHE